MSQTDKTYPEQFIDELNASDCTVVLTGAGVSTDSGIPDFRGPSGLFSKISMRTFQIDFFYDSPDEYYKIAYEHIHTLADKSPNTMHIMLAELEKRDLLHAIITQNIDGLHQKGGSSNVIEFHGDVLSFYCTVCGKKYDRETVDKKITTDGIPNCDCGGLIRPGIVFYGDPIDTDALIQSRMLAENADLFIAMGSSLEVNPAAELALIAKQTGGKLIIVNKGPTRYDDYANLRFEEDLTEFSSAVLNLLPA